MGYEDHGTGVNIILLVGGEDGSKGVGGKGSSGWGEVQRR